MPRRQPKVAAGPAARKPRIAASASTGSENPLFCFVHADRVTDNEWAFTPGADHAPEVVGKLCEFAKLTWREIERQSTGGQRRHRKHHDMDLDKICSDAQADLKASKLDERFGDTLFRFRLGGEKRLWGFRNGRIFHIVWWDPKHKVCPSEKRHT
jgi:hypothetical protein